jgi:plastocyanin
VSLRSILLPWAAAVAVAVLALTLRTHASIPTASSAKPDLSQARHVSIAISNYAFAPKALTVKAGTHVTWTNHDSTAHTATADGGAFDTGTIAPKASHTIDFTRPGTFTYHCAFHAFMTATVTVSR